MIHRYMSLDGIRKAHISQLLFVLKEVKMIGFWTGNKKQFRKREGEIIEWVERILELYK